MDVTRGSGWTDVHTRRPAKALTSRRKSAQVARSASSTEGGLRPEASQRASAAAACRRERRQHERQEQQQE